MSVFKSLGGKNNDYFLELIAIQGSTSEAEFSHKLLQIICTRYHTISSVVTSQKLHDRSSLVLYSAMTKKIFHPCKIRKMEDYLFSWNNSFGPSRPRWIQTVGFANVSEKTLPFYHHFWRSEYCASWTSRYWKLPKVHITAVIWHLLLLLSEITNFYGWWWHSSLISGKKWRDQKVWLYEASARCVDCACPEIWKCSGNEKNVVKFLYTI